MKYIIILATFLFFLFLPCVGYGDKIAEQEHIQTRILIVREVYELRIMIIELKAEVAELRKMVEERQISINKDDTCIWCDNVDLACDATYSRPRFEKLKIKSICNHGNCKCGCQ